MFYKSVICDIAFAVLHPIRRQFLRMFGEITASTDYHVSHYPRFNRVPCDDAREEEMKQVRRQRGKVFVT